MTTQQALDIIEQVCAQYRGTLTEHKHLQQALNVLKGEDKPDEPETENKEKTNES